MMTSSQLTSFTKAILTKIDSFLAYLDGTGAPWLSDQLYSFSWESL